jgi:hypothetical protein
MQIAFDAPSLTEAKDIAEPLAKEFLDYLTFASSLRTRLRDLRHIFNWEPGNDGNRECYYYTTRDTHDGAPYEALDQQLLNSIGMLQAHSPNPRLRRAMKWFANGVSTRFYDDQFVYFWLVVELIAQNAKDPTTPVPDKCPKCQGPLFCETCKTVPTHRPYQKQAIEQLFIKTCAGGSIDGPTFFRQASDARNMLMHGDEVKIHRSFVGNRLRRLGGQYGQARLDLHPQPVHHSTSGETANVLATEPLRLHDGGWCSAYARWIHAEF